MIRRLASLSAVTVVALVLPPAPAHADPPASLLSRAVVLAATAHAIQHAGLDPQFSHRLAARARNSAWLPQFSVRVVRGVGAIAAENYLTAQNITSDDTIALDFRAQFDLSHLVFHPSEVSIERMELRRASQRESVEREVIELLATMETKRAELRTLPNGSPDSVRVQIEFERARARLEAITGLSLDDLTRPP